MSSGQLQETLKGCLYNVLSQEWWVGGDGDGDGDDEGTGDHGMDT